ncbi:MAG: hypothetical protein U0230_15260 [Polyangiales bacterium]
MITHRARVRAAVGLLALASVPTVAHAQRSAATAPAASESSVADYDDLVQSAVEEFNANRFAEARALFERAHALSPNARTLRGMGMAAFELRDYPGAWVALRGALASRTRALTASQRRETQALLARTEVFLGRVELEGLPADASVRLDGLEPARDDEARLLVGPGTHEASVVAADGRRWTRAFEAVPGRTTRLAVQFPESVAVVPGPESVARASAGEAEASSPRSTNRSESDRPGAVPLRKRWWLWTLVGVGVAAAVAVPIAVTRAGGGSDSAGSSGNGVIYARRGFR